MQRQTQVWLKALNAPLIAALVATLAAVLTFKSSADTTKAQYVSLAISILRPQDAGAESSTALRSWAVALLRTGPVHISDELADELISGKTKLPAEPRTIPGEVGSPEGILSKPYETK